MKFGKVDLPLLNNTYSLYIITEKVRCLDTCPPKPLFNNLQGYNKIVGYLLFLPTVTAIKPDQKRAE